MSYSRWSPWTGWIAPLLFIPSAAAARGDLSPICTDRPAKANATCTVPAGRFQLETSVGDWTVTKADGVQSHFVLIGSSLLKLGLSRHSDVQLGFTPFARLTVKQGGTRERRSGFGDIVVRYKHRLTGDDAKVQIGVIPYVKLPTARKGLGNDKLEGGIAVPVSFALGRVTITLGPELDVLADSDGRGHHPAVINLLNAAVPIGRRLTFAGEIWTNVNFDRAGTLRQASADAAIAYAATNDVQLDIGTNIGLTRDTPDAEIYAGASLRF